MEEMKTQDERIEAALFTSEDFLFAKIFGITGEFPQISQLATEARSKTIKHFIDKIPNQLDRSTLKKLSFFIPYQEDSIARINGATCGYDFLVSIMPEFDIMKSDIVDSEQFEVTLKTFRVVFKKEKGIFTRYL